MEWIACRVTTGKEYDIRKNISNIDKDAQVYIPRKHYIEIKEGILRHKSDRMLPGYILIGTEKPLNLALLKPFLKVVGKVTDEEIAVLRAQEGEKKEDLEVGAKILVIDGPFQGVKGHIKKQNEDGTFDCSLVFQGMEINTTMKPNLVSTIN